MDAHAIDAGISVCRSVFGGLASTRASNAASHLSIDRQTRLSWLSAARGILDHVCRCDRHAPAKCQTRLTLENLTVGVLACGDTWKP
jgi:hypothetical protein